MFESDWVIDPEVGQLWLSFPLFAVTSREIFAFYVFPYKNERPLSIICM